MFVQGEASTAARLLIEPAEERAEQRYCATALWERARALLQHWSGTAQVAALEIDDLQGHQVLALRGARPPVELTLPPGTYHVSVTLANVHRRYTVTLESGAVFSLRVAA